VSERESNERAADMQIRGRLYLAVAAAAALCLLGVATAVEVPSAKMDLSFGDLPKTEEIMTEIFSVLGGSLNEQHDVSEDEVKRHLLRLRRKPSTVGNLLGLAAGNLAGINYTQVYEQFTEQYCSDPSGSRPDAPSISVSDVLYTTTSYTGPTLGVQISMGSCSEIGNKTYQCTRPQLVIVKTPATIDKSGPSVGADKPGGSFSDKSCSWSESKEIGHGESADLYNGGSEVYDYSGYRAAMYGRAAHRVSKVQARFSPIAAGLSNIASKARTRAQAFRMPRIGNLFKRRGLEEGTDFDIHNLDSATKKRLEAVLPGFFPKQK